MLWFYATQPHYAAHLVPITQALSDRTRPWFATADETRIPDEATVVVAGYEDLRRIPTNVVKIAFVEHGAGQAYGLVPKHGSYAGGRFRERVSLFLVPHDRVAELNRHQYPDTPNAIVGSPYMESLPMAGSAKSAQDEKAVIGTTWHWDCTYVPETRSAWSYWRDEVALLTEQYRVLGASHPRLDTRAWNDEHGVENASEGDIIAQADLLIADNTSAIYEATARGLPVLCVDSPFYRPEVRHGLRFWDAIPGLRLAATEGQRTQLSETDHPCPHSGRGHLREAVEAAVTLENPWSVGSLARYREAITAQVYDPASAGQAAALAASALVGLDE